MFGMTPIEMFNINDFQVVSSWTIPNGTPVSISMMLTKTDSLGTRRYIPPTGSTVQLLFLRARAATANSQALTITKTATVTPEDRSIYTISLTADDTRNIISGGVQLVITSGSTVNSVNVPYVIKKSYSAPGF